MSTYALPRPLPEGGTIGIVAPSGAVDLDALDRAAARLTERGYRVVVAPEVRETWRYFAGTDQQRAASFNRAAADPDVHMVMAARGGYGWSRILGAIDWGTVRSTRKLYSGFSDFTAFNLAALSQANLVTVHGPTAATDFGGLMGDDEQKADHAYMQDHFWRLLGGNTVVIEVNDAHPHAPQVLEGTLWGGNISLIAHLAGTPYLPFIEGGILFLEEISEEPYAIERMLLQLEYAGVLKRQRAIVLGQFYDCLPKNPLRYPYSLLEVVETLRERLGNPIVTNFPFGHVAEKAALPFGVQATLAINNDGYSLHYALR